MLPQPTLSRGKARIYFPSHSPQNTSSAYQLFNHLRSRTRLTNLAVFLLALALAGSLLLNVQYLYPAQYTRARVKGSTPPIDGWRDIATPDQLHSGVPLSIETTVERDTRYTELDHLIMVPGHAIWVGNDVARITDDDQWILEPMQKGGSVRTYVKHIEEGVERLKSDPRALLVFSG